MKRLALKGERLISFLAGRRGALPHKQLSCEFLLDCRPPDRISGICSALRCWARAAFPNIISLSGQAYAPEKILKALIRAVSVKNRVDREVSHPNSVIVIGGLHPFECVLFLI
jgi:hypothetical protein